ncbi:MAG: hypothetical protein L0Z50_39370 [Verrucomicrobiales bacterium]|nr:hypothetical protein [Verrucomicrobiales bacterium]
MTIDHSFLQSLFKELPSATQTRFEEAVNRIVAAKQRGGQVVVITGSGPNVHEGVTTLIAELMRVGLVDGVTTSSAVVSHEIGGTLDLVKRCPGESLGLPKAILPRGEEFELTLMDDDAIRAIGQHTPIDWELIKKLKQSPGKTIIKAAGNLGYPMGLWLEKLSQEILALAREHGRSYEEVAGLGADERTMIGIGARRGLPVLVTIPQLIGGGAVGLCIGDSLTLTERASRLAHLLASADVIIESGVALTQEIHDGPFETYTGHGLWSAWQGHYSYSLAGKTLIRIDLDPALEQVWEIERGGGAVTQAIADGLPKTKMFKVPFRMEMSGFARHEGSLPLIGDLGSIWPLLAWKCSAALGVELQFLSYPQQSEPGKAVRDEIVRNVKPLNRDTMLQALRSHEPKTGR